MKKINFLVLSIGLICAFNTSAQTIDNPDINGTILRQDIENSARLISTGVPLLLISPDSRAGALADIGAASKPDAYSNHWNAAKLAFAEDKIAVAFTYSPWLRDLVGDIDLAYLAGYYKLNDISAIGASLTYFSLGAINFLNAEGVDMGTFNPNEFAIDLSYSMKLSESFSAAVTGRYIRSDLTQGQSVAGNSTHAASAVSADVGLYYQKDLTLDKPQQIAVGLQISNLGNKISYSDDLERSFLPANLRLGGRYTYQMDQFNKVSFLAEVNKLLVPTPPVRDSANEVYAGMEDNVGVLQGVFQSFYDAPNGFKEELQEFIWSLGVEYWYNNIIAARAGYFHEAEKKGARQYLTLGLGLKYNTMGIDVSYLVPTSRQNNNPLKNTLRVSLSFELK